MTDSIFQFGLERETLRVDCCGNLTLTPHPFEDPAFERDFCESQLEIITPVCPGIDAVYAELYRLDQQARRTLSAQGESLWMDSNPPPVQNEDSIPIAHYNGSLAGKTRYREYLAARYGKLKMLFSGIHFNFSLRPAVLAEKFPAHTADEVYFQLYQHLSQYTWLITLLTAASPAEGAESHIRYASVRSGAEGYWNFFTPHLDHSSLKAFTASIQAYVDRGLLRSAAELYMPIRLKPPGLNDLQNLAKNGISHIELRMLDLNPLAPIGVFKEDLHFIRCLLLWILEMPDFLAPLHLSAAAQEAALQRHKNAALYDIDIPDAQGLSLRQRAEQILAHMAAGADAQTLAHIAVQQKKLLPGGRYCEQLTQKASPATA